jgi:glutamine synthetase
MSTKTDFTPEEWETLRNAPYLAAAAVMVAGRSGILGSIKEAFVIADIEHPIREKFDKDRRLALQTNGGC